MVCYIAGLERVILKRARFTKSVSLSPMATLQATNVAKSLQKELNNSLSNRAPPDYSIRICGCARGTWPKVWTRAHFNTVGWS